MNITHLKYAVEVDKTGSISRAADNLYMSQPNLSKAVKELENTLGFQIFKRTSKGITTTKKGAEFLEYARNILSQMETIEQMYCADNTNKLSFSISVPRASYIADAFTQFVNTCDTSKEIDFTFSETNSMTAIDHIIDGDFNLGIIRCQEEHENYFCSLLDDKNMKYETLLNFEYKCIFSKRHKLAGKDVVREKDFEDSIELYHGDITVPFIPQSKQRENQGERYKKRIYVFERGSQFDLLRNCPNTYMWVSPISNKMLETNGLVQKKIEGNIGRYIDMLIYPKEYKLSDLDKKFLEILKEIIAKVKED